MTANFYPASAPEMPEAFWIELAEENPLGSDKITAQDAADTFYLLWWGRYKTYSYGRSRDSKTHERMIARWWSRVEGHEITEARHVRRVKLGLAKPLKYRTRRGSTEMPQEPRTIGESQKAERLRLVRGG